jgi:hypothetical protein
MFCIFASDVSEESCRLIDPQMPLNEEHLAFFYELGLAISQWSFVESAIYKLIASRLNKEDRRAIGFGLFAVENFRSKVAFSDALLKKKIKDKSHIEEWDKLVDRLKKTVVKRNRLAHDRVMIYANNNAGRRLALEHWPSDKPKRQGSAPKPADGALCIRDVIGVRKEIFYLLLALQNFHAKLSGQSLPPQNPTDQQRVRRRFVP